MTVLAEPLLAALTQALDAAHAVERPEQRRGWVARAAVAAIRRGAVNLGRETLIDLDDPGARAWLHTELAAWRLAEGDTASAVADLGRAASLLDRVDRWWIRDDAWMGPEPARARVAALAARSGALGLAHRLVAGLRAGGLDRAHALASVWAAGAPTEREAGFAAALAAARGLPDAGDARRALQHLAEQAVRCGEGPRALALLGVVIDAEGLGTALQRAMLAESVARTLARAERLDEAARAWGHAARVALSEQAPTQPAMDTLCRIAEDQLEFLGPTLAELTMERAVARAAAQPLSPDPNLAYPWRRLCQVSLQHPALAEPLRDHLRAQSVVPPGWCFVLGLLDLAGGQPRRAERAAAALEKSHSLYPEDMESLWLSALLRCRLGEIEPARATMHTVLAELEPGHSEELPGAVDGPDLLEAHFVQALLDAGAVPDALALARTVVAPASRAALLLDVAQVALDDGQVDATAGVAREAGAALDEAAAEQGGGGAAASALPVRTALLLWRCGELVAARRVLDQALGRVERLAAPLAMATLCGVATTVLAAQALPLADAVDPVVSRRIRTAPPGEARCELVLDWLEARFPVQG